MKLSYAAALLAVTAPALWAEAADAAPKPFKLKESTYTNHNYMKCPSDKASSDDVIRKNCAGVAAITVTWTKNGSSSGLWFGRSPMKESFDLGKSYSPSSTIEWRLGKSSGSRPVATIVPYSTSSGGRTVVYRLEPSGASSCVMAILPGGATAKARALIDSDAEGFRCGSSKRIGG